MYKQRIKRCELSVFAQKTKMENGTVLPQDYGNHHKNTYANE